MHTLVIIDVQHEFEPDESIIPAIVREVELCKRNNYPIILVEYVSCGETMPDINRAVSLHHRLKRVWKDTDNGSEEIDEAISIATKSKRVRVVGVNTGACVQYTAISLAQDYGYYVEIVEDACADINGAYHMRAISKLKAQTRIKIKYDRIRNALM